MGDLDQNLSRLSHFGVLGVFFNQVYVHNKTPKMMYFQKSPSEKGLWRGYLTLFLAFTMWLFSEILNQKLQVNEK